MTTLFYLIVDRAKADLHDYLARHFADDGEAEVILDRRRGNQRLGNARPDVDRRRGDRRGRAVVEELRTRGFAMRPVGGETGGGADSREGGP